MTTQVPTPVYPTTPPWAAPAASPVPAQAAVAPSGAPFGQHGQLLVPYPEEMHDAVRPRPPAVWPVAVFTLLFSVFGAVSASRRAGRARRGRNSVAPYWMIFALALVAGGFVSIVVATTVALPLYVGVRESGTVKAVQENIVKDGRLQKAAGVTATAAACDPVDVRGSDGLRDYACLLTLENGRTGSLDVTADERGNWVPAERG